jgi:RNA polymerase-interacting CarD/CdnL/TRCF family regulator
MDFHAGEHVIHWMHGFGKIVRMEERNLSGQVSLYYVVQVRDLTIWVPADGEIMSRLRLPTSQEKFERLFTILGGPSETLPTDRYERKTKLLNELKDASAEANCRVIRDLSSHQQVYQLNDQDLLILKRARDSLLGEWTFSMSVPLEQAELELHRLLEHRP